MLRLISTNGKSITKYCKSLDHNSDIELEIRKAVSIANEGRPGPVWLDIPLDIQSKKFLPSKRNNWLLPRY